MSAHTWTEKSEWKIDTELGVAYVKRTEEVSDYASVKQREVDALIDYNADGQLIGIEIIGLPAPDEGGAET